LRNDPVSYLTVDEVLAIHQTPIDHPGGPPGARDAGLRACTPSGVHQKES
jgi:hypothetical protein